MALVSTSQQVTDQNATPVVKVNSLEKGGVVRTAMGFIAAANLVGATTGQWYTFVRVPARARVLGIFHTGGASTGAVKVGLFRPNGGIAIDDACFAAVADLTSNARGRMDTVTEYTAALRDDSLENSFSTAIGTAGATGDAEYDIVCTVITVVNTPQDGLVEVDYVLPE